MGSLSEGNSSIVGKVRTGEPRSPPQELKFRGPVGLKILVLIIIAKPKPQFSWAELSYKIKF